MYIINFERVNMPIGGYELKKTSFNYLKPSSHTGIMGISCFNNNKDLRNPLYNPVICYYTFEVKFSKTMTR